MQQCEVRVKGPGGGRESAIRAIANAGIRVITIKDSTRFHIMVVVRRNGAECRYFDLRLLILICFAIGSETVLRISKT